MGAKGSKCVQGQKVTSAVDSEMTNLRNALAETIRAVHGTAPAAKIVLVNYYQPIPTPKEVVSDGSQVCNLLNNNAGKTHHDAAIILKALNQHIAAAITQSTVPGVSLIDLSTAMTSNGVNHGMCTKTPWIFGGEGTIVSNPQDYKWRVAHPTADGQTAIFNAIVKQAHLAKSMFG